METPVLHAGLMALRLDGLWRGLLIRGPSGAGKSTLSLQLLARGLRLVADDRVILFRSGDRLFGKAPKPLYGLIEARGFGVTPSPSSPVSTCEVVWVVNLVTGEAVERHPDPDFETFAAIPLRRYALTPDDPALAMKFELMLRQAIRNI